MLQPKSYKYLSLEQLEKMLERAYRKNNVDQFDDLAREVNWRYGYAKETGYYGSPLERDDHGY